MSASLLSKCLFFLRLMEDERIVECYVVVCVCVYGGEAGI